MRQRALACALALTLAGSLAATLAATTRTAPASAVAAPPASQQYEVVTRFWGAMPTGVTVSAGGRIFVNFPRWGDDVPFTVGEVRGDRVVPYPDLATNTLNEEDRAGHFQSVQSVVIDAHDRLWVLDTGSPEFASTRYGGSKLVAIDLATDTIVRKILLPPDVALPTTYLNDVRFDLRRGEQGAAFITDSSPSGPNGLIVVDLATGESWRRLHDHPSVRPVKGFLPVIEGAPFMNRPADAAPSHFEVGTDGIAISADGQRIYYCPLSSRRLYSVSVNALISRRRDDSEVARTVRDLGRKGMSDGLETDDRGRVYGGDLEQNAIWRRYPSGRQQVLAQGSELVWPDTLAVAGDGYLYATVNQLNRQPAFHEGTDLREKPYLLVRIPIDAGPVRLAR